MRSIWVLSFAVALCPDYGAARANRDYGVPAPAKAVDLANSHCQYFSDWYRNYWYVPTLFQQHGRITYQAYSDDCEPLDRYIYFRNDTYFKNEWQYDSTFRTYWGPKALIQYVSPTDNLDKCTSRFYIIHQSSGDGTATLTNRASSACLPTTVDTLPIDIFNKCVMSVHGVLNFTFVATTSKSADGYPVYQGIHDDTCQGLNRYLQHRTNTNGHDEWDFDDDLDTSRRLAKVADFKVCPAAAQTVYPRGYMANSIAGGQKSICVPLAGEPALQLDASGKCLMKVTGGLVDFTFLPTTEKRDGFPVFQGYDNTTCEPLNRYLHYGKGAWNYDDDLDIAEAWDRLGRLDPQFEVCPGRTDTYAENGNHLGTFESIPSSRCFLPVEAEAYTQHVVKLDEDGSPVADDAAGF